MLIKNIELSSKKYLLRVLIGSKNQFVEFLLDNISGNRYMCIYIHICTHSFIYYLYAHLWIKFNFVLFYRKCVEFKTTRSFCKAFVLTTRCELFLLFDYIVGYAISRIWNNEVIRNKYGDIILTVKKYVAHLLNQSL